MALQIEFTDEEKAKLLAKRAAKAGRADERNASAAMAYKKALFELCDGDEDKLIVFTMPDRMGGAIVHRLPTHEAWALVSKKRLSALISDGKKASAADTVAALVENVNLLVHPPISELQAYRDELPDLYEQIHTVMDASCASGQSAGK